jgi:hypothetical protein
MVRQFEKIINILQSHLSFCSRLLLDPHKTFTGWYPRLKAYLSRIKWLFNLIFLPLTGNDSIIAKAGYFILFWSITRRRSFLFISKNTYILQFEKVFIHIRPGSKTGSIGFPETLKLNS